MMPPPITTTSTERGSTIARDAIDGGTWVFFLVLGIKLPGRR